MAARDAQFIYSTVFSLLGSAPTPQHKKWAKKLWSDSFQFDFSPEDMACDEELVALGLAKLDRVVDQDLFGDAEEHEVVLYLNSKGRYDY
jgi:hypothetical protein